MSAIHPNPAAHDVDLTKQQARPGMGVPSQDPNVAAQHPIDPATAEREAGSALMGGGAVAGIAAGAALGTALGGPVGTLVGATAGAVAGALGGKAASEATKDSIQGDPVPHGGQPAMPAR